MKKALKIKICGMRDQENILEISGLDPDYMGFIFYRNSPRFLQDGKKVPALKRGIVKTGVFVNAPPEEIKALIANHELDYIQLHGNETPEFCREIRMAARVIKAFGINEDFDFSITDAYYNCADLFLFDTKCENFGGSGKTFDHSFLNKYHGPIPFFLSGGISIESFESIRNLDHPQLYGLDLNSRFEISPGIKNKTLLESFIKKLER